MSTTMQGTAWDPPNGLPDPYCQLSLNNNMTSVGSTALVRDSLMPTWGVVVSGNGVPMSALSGPMVRISVFDDDGTAGPQNICTVMSVPQADFNMSGDIDLGPVQRCTHLLIRLACQP
jgi:hypothetical protein